MKWFKAIYHQCYNYMGHHIWLQIACIYGMNVGVYCQIQLTGFPFNSNSIIHWLSLLCVDVISIVPRKGSSLTVSVRIVAKSVTDLHTDSGLVFHTYSM